MAVMVAVVHMIQSDVYSVGVLLEYFGECLNQLNVLYRVSDIEPSQKLTNSVPFPPPGI